MKNRTLIGIVCIILAVAVTFVVSPIINKMSEGKVEVIRFASDVAKGSQISENDLETAEIARGSLPEKAITDRDLVIGKYANSDMYKGDYITAAKITDNSNSSDNILSAISGGQVAMSFTIDSFAGGLSGKLENGDVISVFVTDKEENTEIPKELKYVRVITTTTSGGVDETEVIPNDDGTFLPSTVTVLVSVEQAEVIANAEKNATMHVALVYRGDEKGAQKYLDKQTAALNGKGE